MTYDLIPSLEVQAIIDRAHTYSHEVYRATGHSPEQFLVSEEDYLLLQMHYGGPPLDGISGEIQLFGMRVCPPERMEETPEPESQTFCGFPIVVDMNLPPGSFRVVPSPARDASADPLPPLDDLDEGLQCCGREYPTFGDFMAHVRQHGVG